MTTIDFGAVTVSISDEINAAMTDEDMHQIGLLRICEDLHGSANGSGDPIRGDVVNSMVNYLNRRLLQWKPRLHNSFSDHEYDESVRRLILATLRYCDVHPSVG